MFVRLLQLPYARLIYCDSPKHCIWQEVLHTNKQKQGEAKQGNPSSAPNVLLSYKMIVVLTAGSRCSKTAPSLQRRRVAEPAYGRRTGIPLRVHRSDAHWQTEQKGEKEREGGEIWEMNLEERETHTWDIK